MDKNAQLRTALGCLNAKQAVALANAVEIQRAMGTETLPAGPILDALRARLREERPARIPDLRRLVVNALEEFLTDRSDEPRVDGLIPRATILPWWDAVRLLVPTEVDAMAVRLKDAIAKDPVAGAAGLQADAYQEAAKWAALVAAELAKPKSDLPVKKLLRGLLADDAKIIAEILSIAKPLTTAIRAMNRVLTHMRLIEERRILDLAPDAITSLKQNYLALSEAHGMSARYLALGVLNRLTQPNQILRLGRALSWKSNDTLVSGTEFGCVGARLIADLQRASQEISAQVSLRGPLPPVDELSQRLSRYFDECEGLLAEMGLRRDSPWGEAILKSRATAADAINRGILDRYTQVALAIMPQLKDGEADVSATPPRGSIPDAMAIGHFLQLLTQRGQRHGFAQAAREAIDALGTEIETRTADLIGEVRETPVHAATIEAQIDAGAKLCELLFDDGRGQLMRRRLANAMRATA